MESVFCVWSESDSSWTCAQCGAVVSKSVLPKRPFSACRVGAEKNCVPFRAVAKAESKKLRPSLPSYAISGPGTELKKLLSRIGFKASPGCKCNSRMIQMNMWGCDECERKLDEIVGWLREEASARRLPFLETIARLLVNRAISSARRH